MATGMVSVFVGAAVRGRPTVSFLKEMMMRRNLTILFLSLISFGVIVLTPGTSASSDDDALTEQLSEVLSQHGFTGRVGSSLEQRLGRKIDNQLAELGRLAFHDSLLGLNNDNSCSGCHAAHLGFGDSQSIAIGVENNNSVGPDRTGPRNQRRMIPWTSVSRAGASRSRFYASSASTVDAVTVGAGIVELLGDLTDCLLVSGL